MPMHGYRFQIWQTALHRITRQDSPIADSRIVAQRGSSRSNHAGLVRDWLVDQLLDKASVSCGAET